MMSAVRILVAMALLLFAPIATAQSPKYPVNEMPMHGGVQKNSEMQNADAALISAIQQSGLSREAAAVHAIHNAWKEFGTRNYAAAMRRFNQAYVLNERHASIYHGFALIVLSRDNDASAGDALFARALNAPEGHNPGIYEDYALFLLMERRYQDALSVLENAKAKGQEGKQSGTYLAMAQLSLGDKEKGCGNASGALQAHMANPQNVARLQSIYDRLCR